MSPTWDSASPFVIAEPDDWCVCEKEREREIGQERESESMQERAGENILVYDCDFLKEFEGIGGGLGTELPFLVL